MLLLVIDSIFAKNEHQPQYYEDGFCTIPKFMKDESARIYHGNTAPSPIPWQVQMEVDGLLRFFNCGGTILDSKTILTAAHCIYNEYGSLKDPSEIRVSAGLTDRTNLTSAQVKHTFYRIPSHLSCHTIVIQIPTSLGLKDI